MTTLKPSRFTHSGNILLAGFAGMIIMMSVLVYLCVKQDFSLVSKDYYEQELVYQDKIDASENASSLSISVDKDGPYVRLSLPAEISKQITNGSVYFYCPSDEKMDRTKALQASDDGVYTFDKQMLQGSSYIIKLSFDAGGKSFYKEIKL